MSVDALRSAIVTAFASVPAPADDALVRGDPSYDPELRDVVRAFAGQGWQELSVGFIHDHRDELPLLTPAAFRFFLPAYLLACLESEDELDTAPLSVVLSLTPPADSAAARAFVERAALFTPDQARAIHAALLLLKDRGAAPGGLLEQAVAFWRLRAL